MTQRSALRLRPALIAGATLLACALGAAAAEPPEVAIPGDRVFPESITSTSDGALIIGSLAEGMVFRAPPGATMAEPWIKPGTAGLRSVFGVLADEADDTLWVCSTDFSALGVAVPGGRGPTSLKSFDLKTGAPKGSVALPGEKTLCNDIAIGPDGAAYVTDSFNPRILRLRPGGSAFEIWAADPRFAVKGAGLDGVAFGGDGSLYTDLYVTGLMFRVARRPDGSAGPVTELQTSRKLVFPDAIRRLGANTLLLIEGGGRLDRVTLDGDKAEIATIRDGYKVPTSVTQTGRSAWVVEGQLDHLFDPKLKDQQPAPFKAYEVPLDRDR